MPPAATPPAALHDNRHTSATGRKVMPLWPGVSLCLLITATAFALEAAERAVANKAWLEALVLAILAGTALRTAWMPSRFWQTGIDFSAKYLLEAAVVLLGATVSSSTLLSVGTGLVIGVPAVVIAAIGLSYGTGRLLGLPVRMALLVACGNSICGNSAIAAVAPVIGADSDDVAAAIAFTAVLGVGVVLGLPLAGLAMGMSPRAFGELAGLTVYAVPQVIAAAAPMGAAAVQMGTLVKLVRVLMLGPVCFGLALAAPRLSGPRQIANGRTKAVLRPGHLIPWFITGFLAMVACRSLGLIPACVLPFASQVANLLTVVSMAALGLGVDVRTVARAGARVTAAVILSLAGLGAISLGLIALLAGA